MQTQSIPVQDDRPMRPAFFRGWRRCCPACGSGPLLRNYLKVREGCLNCGLEYHHHRADDGPAYLTILVVGHVMAPLMHVYWTQFRPQPLIMATVLSIGCVALSMYLLPRIKGALIGIQWSRRMYGFGKTGA